MQTYTYIPNHDESLLHTLKEVKHKSFTRECLYHEDVAVELGYVKGKHDGLKLKDDQMVRYHKATYDGKPAMYFVRRGIKYVWVDSCNS
jgi:hypothetical protein